MSTNDDDDVTRDPVEESLHDRAVAMAEADVAADRDPQVLTGELACVSDDYEDAYLAALLAKQLSSN
jgi:hypothetical protein